MSNVFTWIALPCIVVVPPLATTVVSRLAYGSSRTIDSLSPAEFEARFRRARSAGWLCSCAWIISAVLVLLLLWPPTGWVIGYLAVSAVMLVAVLIGLDAPRTSRMIERYFHD